MGKQSERDQREEIGSNAACQEVFFLSNPLEAILFFLVNVGKYMFTVKYVPGNKEYYLWNYLLRTHRAHTRPSNSVNEQVERH